MRLRFWLRSAFSTAGVLVAASCVYTLLMQLQTDDYRWSEILMTITIYLWCFGAFMSMFFTMSLYKSALPLCLSFGSTRKEAAVGIQLQRLIPMVVMAVVSLVLALVYEREFFQTMLKVLPGACGAYLILNSVGTVIGTAQVKFGNKSLFLTIPALILFIVACFFMGYFAASRSPAIADFLLSPAIVWMALGAGVIVHGLSLIPEIKTVRHCNVKL